MTVNAARDADLTTSALPDRDAAPRPPREGLPSHTGMIALLIGYAVVLVGMGFGVYASQFRISNIDGLSYISLAQQYADGSFSTAVNAFWSPLVSWLMAPFIAAGLSGTVSFLVVNFASGAIGVAIGTILVLRHTRANSWAGGIYLVGAGTFNVSSVYLLTPDLLVANWAVLFVAVLTWVTSGSPWRTRRDLITHSAVLGAICAAGYLTKLYLVPVMVVVLALWAAWIAVSHRASAVGDSAPGVRRIAALLGSTLLVFALLAAPWVAALTSKYGHVTLGSSFTVNIESKFDPTTADGQSVPLVLYAPPNDRAISFGEDRTFDSDGSLLTSDSAPLDRLRFYVSQRIAAFPFYLDKIASIAPFAAMGVAALLLAMAFGRVSARRHPMVTVASLVWLVYFIGYAGITTAASSGGSARYYWPVLPLWLLVAAAVAPPLWLSAGAQGQRWRSWLAIALICIVPAATVWQFGLGRSAPFSTSPGPAGVYDTVASTPERSTEQVLAESDLSQFIAPGDKIVGSNFRTTVLMAFYLGAQVFGRAAQPYDVDDPEFRSLLRSNGIDYYLHYARVAGEVPVPDGIAELGRVVVSRTEKVPCADYAGAPAEECVLTLVKVEG